MNSGWLVTYDIADPRRLRLASRILETAGLRIQRSIYFIEGMPEGIGTLEQLLRASLDSNEDRLRIYRLCSWCRGRTSLRPPPDQGYWLV